ncbi:MAG: 1,2-phenylacetyl-CoA epoxidase subunit PaaC [Halobacteriales archaeon]|nr:1,2-phenylacetyl-CoA epoxidase subunit PaaC [Halobacteriales archaeon]
MAAAESLAGPDELADDEREAVAALLFRLADDEFVMGDRYTDWQVRSPTLESDLALSNIAQDEIGHARLWYDLLEDFGHTEADLIWTRPADDFTHATLCELPFDEGDWADVIVRSYLYDAAEAVRLESLIGSSYPRIRDRVEKVIDEEDYHVNHGRRWLERLVEGEDGRGRVQAALDRLYPHALTLFAPGEHEGRIDELGLRTDTLDAQREAWAETTTRFLESLDLAVPEADLPDAVGRDRSHTEHWADQHAEITRAFEELGRSEVRRIMKDPDDGE